MLGKCKELAIYIGNIQLLHKTDSCKLGMSDCILKIKTAGVPAPGVPLFNFYAQIKSYGFLSFSFSHKA